MNNTILRDRDILHPNVADRIMEWVDSEDIELLGVPEEWSGNVPEHQSQIYSAIETSLLMAQKMIRDTTTFDNGDSAANGVSEWVKMPFNTIISNGVLKQTEENKSFWFIDVISSYCPRLRQKQERGEFYVCYALPTKERTCHILFTDGGRSNDLPDDIFVYQFVPFTTLEKPLKFYLSTEEKNLILTPAEYM